jgi:putative Mg2+ transporter-C (MgtC) family protein
MLALQDLAIRLFAASVIGFIIGITRKHKPAGIRTFALICLGSAIFTIVSMDQSQASPVIIAQIVSGIGFLGLGVIWKHGGKPTGLTTAAAMWVSAALGVLIGLGLFAETAIGAMLAIAILYSKGPLVKAKLEEEE